MKYKTITWKELQEHVKLIADSVRTDGFKPTGIYGMPRGGLVPAVILSHELDVPLLLAPCKGCLVVDDIADSGVTLQHFAECKYQIAVIWWKPRSKVQPTYWAKCGNEDGAWIVFPWETPVEEK